MHFAYKTTPKEIARNLSIKFKCSIESLAGKSSYFKQCSKQCLYVFSGSVPTNPSQLLVVITRCNTHKTCAQLYGCVYVVQTYAQKQHSHSLYQSAYLFLQICVKELPYSAFADCALLYFSFSLQSFKCND